MKTLDTATRAALGARAGMVARALVWVRARNRATGALEAIGFWTGEDHRDFVIGGETRTYFGAGALLALPEFTVAAGLEVRMHEISLSALAPEVAQLLRGYEARFAPVEVHVATFAPESFALVAEPVRIFKGYIDAARIVTPKLGEAGSASITVASASRALTRGLALKKSDATQSLRQGDRFRRYTDVSGSVEVWWGEASGIAWQVNGPSNAALATGLAALGGGAS